jgi:hypothetical protein
MIGGHYIAYVLVDPEVMFSSETVPSGTEQDMTDGSSVHARLHARATHSEQ